MCVEKKTLLNLCDLYPKTAENLKMRGLEKREVYMKFMKHENLTDEDVFDISRKPRKMSSNVESIDGGIND